jgi:cellulose biosynthesis protein BcsQ
VSSNLAAYFDVTLGKRVLLIDFDYQGSLSDSVQGAAQLQNIDFSAFRLISRIEDAEKLLLRAHTLNPALPHSRLFPAFYEFNKQENKVLLSWLSGKDKNDIRYNLHTFCNPRRFRSNLMWSSWMLRRA